MMTTPAADDSADDPAPADPGPDPAGPARPTDADGICDLARAHGLELDPESVRADETGLDFRAVFARATAGEDWLLRIPRRDDVTARADVEARALATIAPHLSFAVPDWRIHTRELIAYPVLPGTPGLKIGADGAPHWHVDMASHAYALSFGQVAAEIRSLDPEALADVGVPSRSPAQVREQREADLDRVADAFDVAPDLHERWRRWIADDAFWPDRTEVTHGELYPVHTLVDGASRITSVLDWTTIAVDDPARDLAIFLAAAPPEAAEAMLGAYVEQGGSIWPRLADHCTEIIAASPLDHGVFALETGDPAQWEAAAGMLNPDPAG